MIFNLMRPVSVTEQIATMYSYNGSIILPIPHSTRQYIYLSYYPNPRLYSHSVFYSDTPAIYDANEKIWKVDDSCLCASYYIYKETPFWGDLKTQENVLGFIPIGEENPDLENPAFDETQQLLWCNIDVKYQDGTVFLSASEPVPVYE